MHSIPLDIFVRILGFFISSDSLRYRRRHIQFVRLVCQDWNDVVISTPEFWRGISIHIGLRPHANIADTSIVGSQQLHQHLERAGNDMGLDVHLTLGSPRFHDSLRLAIQLALSRARCISIYARHLDLSTVANLFLDVLSRDRLEVLRIWAGPIPTAELATSPFPGLIHCTRLSFLGLPAPLPAFIHSDSVTSLELYRPSHADIEVLPTHFPNLTTLYVTDPQQVTGSPIHFPNLLGLYVRSFQPTQGILDHISAPNLTITYVTVHRW